MGDLTQSIWQRLRHTPDGRRLAGGLVAAVFGASAAAGISPTTRDVVIYSAASGIMGSVAVSLLEWRDQRRAQKLRGRNGGPEISPNPGVGEETGTDVLEENAPRGFLWWFGVVAGSFSIFCGVAMAIVRVIKFLAH